MGGIPEEFMPQSSENTLKLKQNAQNMPSNPGEARGFDSDLLNNIRAGLAGLSVNGSGNTGGYGGQVNYQKDGIGVGVTGGGAYGDTPNLSSVKMYILDGLAKASMGYQANRGHGMPNQYVGVQYTTRF